jgi:hypothetical protein
VTSMHRRELRANRIVVGAAFWMATMLPATVGAQQAGGPDALSLQEAIALARRRTTRRFLQQQNDLVVARSSVAIRPGRESSAHGSHAAIRYGYTASGERRFESVGLGTQPETVLAPTISSG